MAFRFLIALFHNALFLGRLSPAYDANAHTPASPWGPLVILAPVLASLGVTFITSRFAPEARGHGVPEVIDAIYHGQGILRPVVVVVKAVASALSIGSGGSVGREGPIAQIGAALGSNLARLLSLSLEQRLTLIAAGAGAGIAATFNTPIGGALFAIELILTEVSARTVVPVLLAAATASMIGRLAFGAEPSFLFAASGHPPFAPPLRELLLLPLYAGLGVLLGLFSAVYIRSIYVAEDLFARWVAGRYRRHAVGMAGVGVAMYLVFLMTGHYAIEGVGYATIADILSGRGMAAWLLLLLCALKLAATATTLGSGASGGIFSPGLFMGATLGAAYGIGARLLWPASGVEPAVFAIAGMAGLVGGATGAALTAIVMTMEMTLDVRSALPVVVVVALSYGIRRLLCADSIYTMKLTRRGETFPDALRAERTGPGAAG